jgi:hypothetical protein
VLYRRRDEVGSLIPWQPSSISFNFTLSTNDSPISNLRHSYPMACTDGSIRIPCSSETPGPCWSRVSGSNTAFSYCFLNSFPTSFGSFEAKIEAIPYEMYMLNMMQCSHAVEDVPAAARNAPTRETRPITFLCATTSTPISGRDVNRRMRKLQGPMRPW